MCLPASIIKNPEVSILMSSYICNVCKNPVEHDENTQILEFNGYFVCSGCYLKLNGAELSDIKEILLRIEKKIDSKMK